MLKKLKYRNKLLPDNTNMFRTATRLTFVIQMHSGVDM